MKLCEFSLASAMLCLLVSPIFAQGGDFFWSFESNGPVNEDVSRKDFSVGDTGSLFLYYTTNGPAMSELNTGAFLDLATSNSGVVEFTAAETFDFDVALASDTSIVFGTRWGNSFGAGDVSDDGPSVGINAFTVSSGDRIVNANNGTALSWTWDTTNPPMHGSLVAWISRSLAMEMRTSSLPRVREESSIMAKRLMSRLAVPLWEQYLNLRPRC